MLDNATGSTLGNASEIAFLTDSGASYAGISNVRIKAINTNAGNGAADLTLTTYDGSSEGERMRITSSGNVAIGSSVVIKTDGTGAYYTHSGSGNTVLSSSDGNEKFVANDTGYLQFEVAGAVAGKWDSTGLGIGGTPTAGILHTIGTGNQTVKFECTDNNNVTLALDADRSADSTLANVQGQWNGTAVGEMKVLSGADDTNKDDGHLTFSTAAAGTLAEAMRIDSTGNVGIGTSTFRTGGNLQIKANTSESAYLDIDSYNDLNAGLRLYENDVFKWQLYNDGDASDVFKVDSASGTAITVDQSGNVGIATAAPNTSLTIGGDNTISGPTSAGSENSGLILAGGGASGNTRGASMRAYGNEHATNGGELRLYAGAVPGGDIIFNVDSADVMTVDASQNVGIGSGGSSPTSVLHVADSRANEYLAYIYNSNDNVNSHGLNVQTTNTNAACYGLRVNTGGNSNALVAMGSGNVGICKLPTTILDINDHSGTGLRLTRSTVETKLTNSLSQGLIGTVSDHDFVLRSNATDRLTITSGGQVYSSIKETTNSSDNTVSYTIDFDDENLQYLHSSDSGAQYLDLNTESTSIGKGKTVTLRLVVAAGYLALDGSCDANDWKWYGLDNWADNGGLTGDEFLLKLTCWGASGNAQISAEVQPLV